MKESEVIQLVQQYRHDILNQLQLVQGYLSMNKPNKVGEKLADLFSSLNEERKLTSLEAPKFALWLLQFNHSYNNFRITYQIDMESSLSLENQDDKLFRYCKDIMEVLKEHCDPSELYDLHLIMKINEKKFVELSIMVDRFKDQEHSLKLLEKNKIINVVKTDSGTIFRIEIPMS